MARQAVLAAILTIYKKAGSAGAAISPRAMLGDTAPLSEGERLLLLEWLDRLAAK